MMFLPTWTLLAPLNSGHFYCEGLKFDRWPAEARWPHLPQTNRPLLWFVTWSVGEEIEEFLEFREWRHTAWAAVDDFGNLVRVQ